MTTYRCYQCSSTDLGVTVLASAKLIQDGDDIQTEVTGDQEFDHCHNMWCNHCGYSSIAAAFYVGDRT